MEKTFRIITNTKGDIATGELDTWEDLEAEIIARDAVVTSAGRDAMVTIEAFDADGRLLWDACAGSLQCIGDRVARARARYQADIDERELGDEYAGLRVDMLDSLTQYVEQRRQVGGFLRAVLENDLVGAVSRADDVEARNIPTWVRYCYNRIPNGVWGSPHAVRKHLREG